MFKFLFAHGDTHSRVGAKDFLQALVCLINAIFEGGGDDENINSLMRSISDLIFLY